MKMNMHPPGTVFLNVYDVLEVNHLLYAAGLGVFHSAIEVYGMEFAYGRCSGGSGVFSCRPKRCPPHIFREQLVLGRTSLPEEEVHHLIRRYQEDLSPSPQLQHLHGRARGVAAVPQYEP